MLFELLSALQGTELASALRASRWVYPLVNAGHIAGLALLIGSIVPLDLRLLGLWRSQPIAPLARVLLPVTVSGLALAVTTGALLFSVHAVKYAGTTLFQVKLLLILAALANAALLRRSPAWKAQRRGEPPPLPLG
ncbi:MAG: hypothetical protein ACREDZ_01230, partial [Kiloniellales bacterium]